MKQRSKFEIMRRNRGTLERAAKALKAEQEWEAERQRYLDERSESYEDTRDWLAETREQARLNKNPPIPSNPQPIEQLPAMQDERFMGGRWWPFRRRDVSCQ